LEPGVLAPSRTVPPEAWRGSLGQALPTTGPSFTCNPVSWLAYGAGSGEVRGHAAMSQSGTEGGEHAWLRPRPCPFPHHGPCHPTPSAAGELTSGPEDTEAYNIQAERTCGDQGLGLLVKLWGKWRPRKGLTCPRTQNTLVQSLAPSPGRFPQHPLAPSTPCSLTG